MYSLTRSNIIVEYKSIKEIVQSLSKEIDRLENGELTVEELESVLNDVRSLHERIAILQYLAVQPKESSEKSKKPTSFSFGVDQNMLDSLREPSNQTNLLDAIEQEKEPFSASNEDVKEVKEMKVDTLFGEELSSEEPVENLKAEIKPVTDAVAQEERKSINDNFSSQREVESLADRLSKKPITDLIEAIGLNQKFLFMNDLFDGENNLYKEALDSLNSFQSFIEADEYMNVLRARHNWDSTSKSVKDFIELVERRYS